LVFAASEPLTVFWFPKGDGCNMPGRGMKVRAQFATLVWLVVASLLSTPTT